MCMCSRRDNSYDNAARGSKMRRAMYHDGDRLFPAKMGAAELNRVRYEVGW
jgi:hypothetical protein